MKKFLFFLLPLLLVCSVNAKEFRGVWVATVENLDLIQVALEFLLIYLKNTFILV